MIAKKTAPYHLCSVMYAPLYVMCGICYATILYFVYPFLSHMRAFHAFRAHEHSVEHIAFSAFIVFTSLIFAAFVRNAVYKLFNSAYLFSVFIPSMVLYPYFDPNLIYGPELFTLLVASILFSVVGYFVGDRKTFSVPFSISRRKFIYFIALASLINTIIILITFRDIFSFVGLFDVYQQRFLYRANMNIVSYLIHWQMMVLSPLCVFIGSLRKISFLTWVGFAGALVVYGVTAFKMAPAIVVVILFAVHLRKVPNLISVILFIPLAFLILLCGSVCFDYFIADEPVLIYFIVDRNMVGPGVIQLMTLETFKDMPKALWSHSFLRFFVDPVHDLDPFIITGLHFFGREVRANSGFVADGFINGGLWGIIISTCIASAAIYITSLVFNGLPKIFAVALLPFVLSIINGPVQVTLLTNGLIMFWMLALLYKDAFISDDRATMN